MIDYRVSVAVGVIVMGAALIFRWGGRMTTFRIMLLVGFIYFIGGMIVWNILGPWVGVALMALWFITAFYFTRAERRERAKARRPPPNTS
jgi:hypothetical protein